MLRLAARRGDHCPHAVSQWLQARSLPVEVAHVATLDDIVPLLDLFPDLLFRQPLLLLLQSPADMVIRMRVRQAYMQCGLAVAAQRVTAAGLSCQSPSPDGNCCLSVMTAQTGHMRLDWRAAAALSMPELDQRHDCLLCLLWTCKCRSLHLWLTRLCLQHCQAGVSQRQFPGLPGASSCMQRSQSGPCPQTDGPLQTAPSPTCTGTVLKPSSPAQGWQ